MVVLMCYVKAKKKPRLETFFERDYVVNIRPRSRGNRRPLDSQARFHR